MVAGNTQFALDLYDRLRQGDGNLFFSPYSVSTALAMTYAGTHGQTAQEMARTLHFALEPQRLHPSFAELLRSTRGDKRQHGYELNVANALWCQHQYPLLPDFLDTTRKHYGSGVGQADFINSGEQARRDINSWVANQTGNRIKDLLRPGDLSADTRLVLTNAIYFKGDWDAPFERESTKNDDFYLTPQRKVHVPLMWQHDHFGYLDGGSFQVLALPYRGRLLSMLILLPKKVDGLGELEKSLREDTLAKWLANMHTQDAEVYLPRFKMTQRYSLQDVLARMGMPSLFDPAARDLSGINNTSDRPYLTKVIHQAFVEVNETGTEAAAATASLVLAGAAPSFGPPPQPVIFRADHPFLYLIRDNRSGSILFMGRVTNPETLSRMKDEG